MDSILPKEVLVPRRRSARLKNKNVNTQQLPKPNPVRVPYPGRLKEKPEKLGTFKLDRKSLDFLSIVPNQNRYIRSLLSTMERMPDSNKIPLSEECTKLHRDSLPMKLGDTRRFTFSCSIYQSGTIHALADLGASINLMPYSLFKRLELGDLLPTKVTIQLTDHTIRYPKGIDENILVKVDRFMYPTDFVVIDIKEDLNTPIILGRLFMNTTRIVIDVYNQTLVLRSHGECVTFKIDRTTYIFEQEEMFTISNSRITSDDESPPSATDTEISITPPEPHSNEDPEMEEEDLEEEI
ncbi:uncharacterized protein [Rutidosis leptorrhynchoides]|uniref:uncharacterized protein n=1 Tax=Rutidosis leptorrhynchoides TaxID=125765 RepID=UPI003A9A3DA2